jgi:hypothetical protein
MLPIVCMRLSEAAVGCVHRQEDDRQSPMPPPCAALPSPPPPPLFVQNTQLLCDDAPDGAQREVVQGFPNLVAYVERIKGQYYQHPVESVPEKGPAPAPKQAAGSSPAS